MEVKKKKKILQARRCHNSQQEGKTLPNCRFCHRSSSQGQGIIKMKNIHGTCQGAEWNMEHGKVDVIRIIVEAPGTICKIGIIKQTATMRIAEILRKIF